MDLAHFIKNSMLMNLFIVLSLLSGVVSAAPCTTAEETEFIRVVEDEAFVQNTLDCRGVVSTDGVQESSCGAESCQDVYNYISTVKAPNCTVDGESFMNRIEHLLAFYAEWGSTCVDIVGSAEAATEQCTEEQEEDLKEAVADEALISQVGQCAAAIGGEVTAEDCSLTECPPAYALLSGLTIPNCIYQDTALSGQIAQFRGVYRQWTAVCLNIELDPISGDANGSGSKDGDDDADNQDGDGQNDDNLDDAVDDVVGDDDTKDGNSADSSSISMLVALSALLLNACLN